VPTAFRLSAPYSGLRVDFTHTGRLVPWLSRSLLCLPGGRHSVCSLIRSPANRCRHPLGDSCAG